MQESARRYEFNVYVTTKDDVQTWYVLSASRVPAPILRLQHARLKVPAGVKSEKASAAHLVWRID